MTIEDIFRILYKRLVFVLVLPFVCMSIATYYFYAVMPNEYTASSTLYILNRQSESTVIGQGDLSASLSLVSDYKKLLKSRRVTDAVLERLGLPSLSAYKIDVTADANTRVIDLIVTGTDPATAANIANILTEEFAKSVEEIMQAENVNIVDRALPPTQPSGPPRARNTLLALMLGAAAAVGLVLAAEMLRVSFSGAQEVEQVLEIPVIGQIPERKIKG